jgi:DNA-binding SARP family transcriptional activator
VLALLLAEPNVTVSVDRLIDGVWGEDPPDSARHTLQAYVSELRKVVGDVIDRDGIGYVLRASRSDLDALDLEARVSEALAGRTRPGDGGPGARGCARIVEGPGV